MSSNHKDYGYGKGEKDGSNGKYDPPNSILDDLFTWSDSGMKRIDEENRSYDKGYVHGKGQRDSSNGYYDGDYTGSKGYNEGWSNGSSGSGSSGGGGGGGCYLTTACTMFKGLPDDCSQLETLRSFRDNYVAAQPEGKDLIKEYYVKAPLVVNAIGLLEASIQTKVYNAVFDRINLACSLINNGENANAFDVYVNISRKMYAVFIGKS